MTFWGGRMAEEGLERVVGIGSGVDICSLEESLFPFSDFLRDFILGRS